VNRVEKIRNLLSLLFLLSILLIHGCGDDKSLTVDAPNARFTFEIDTDDPLTVVFTNASLNATSYSWDFGGDGISTETSPTHTFSAGGSYNVMLTASNEDGEDVSSNAVTVEDILGVADLVGHWRIASEAGSMHVGPTAGSAEWWSLSEADVTTRACFLDDKYSLGSDGSFTIEMDGDTWLETWQSAPATCSAPLAPHDGSGSYTYQATDITLTVSGAGAFMGLPKANNAGELPDVDVPISITYDIAEFYRDGNNKRLVLSIECGTGLFWTFHLISQ